MELLKKYSILFFAGFLFFLSSGFGYYKSSCVDNCETKISFLTEMDDCCLEEKQHRACCDSEEDHQEEKELHKDDCCDVEYYSVDLDTEMQKSDVASYNFDADFILEQPCYGYCAIKVLISEKSSFNLRGPPLILTHRDRLIQKNSFLI